MQAPVLIRGGGELASGVALRLHRAGINLVITELPQPLAVRRWVAFAEAVYQGEVTIEGVSACLVENIDQAAEILATGAIPVLVDPEASVREALNPLVLVDARLTKRPSFEKLSATPLVIGLGPGFVAGSNCHAAIETNRGHFLGRVIWQGSPEPDTGVPEGVASRSADRVLRAPVEGEFQPHASIGDLVSAGDLIATVDGQEILAPFQGVVRGLIHGGLDVRGGLKVGDVDPRGDPRYCSTVSDKSLAVGGGVLEAILSRPDLRRRLWP